MENQESKKLPASIFIFGLVSFLTDVSSDMMYPLLPLFLTQYLGAKQGFLGFVEGFADSTAAFFMLFSGVMADRMRDRSRLVLSGYSLSGFSRCFMAIASHPFAVFFIRAFDRLGKGIRTSPRDALIADSVHPSVRGKAFGLQRSMDHAGAVVGPLTAALLLSFWTKNLRSIFVIAAIPGILTIFLILWKVREIFPDRPSTKISFKFKFPTGRLRIYLVILFLFLLSCSTDAFLLLRASQLGVPNALLPLLWMLFNLVKAFTTMPLGMLSDKLGRRSMILIGWLIYTLVYLGFGAAQGTWQVWGLFIVYGFFYGFTDGTERALLADYAEGHDRGQAFGWYYFVTGISALPASLIFGMIWQQAGSQSAFFISAAISAFAAFLLFLFLTFFPSVRKT